MVGLSWVCDSTNIILIVIVIIIIIIIIIITIIIRLLLLLLLLLLLSLSLVRENICFYEWRLGGTLFVVDLWVLTIGIHVPTIMDKFLWDNCFYLSPVHIFGP